RYFERLGQGRGEQHYSTTRAQQSPSRWSQHQPQAPGSDGRVSERARIHEKADPRALCESDLFWRRLLRRRNSLASVLWQKRLKTEPSGSGLARGSDSKPEPIFAAKKSGRRCD